ncbi:MAG: hypothetical protein LBT34_02880 [Clostridiales Family XIII bacterium]|jgi:hypothetical protein|nr:hypothetical protein [Clostridiales Family XIII bacterium]
MNSKKGSFTVEAAIFLPIFIIGVLTVAYLIKLTAVQENVFHSCSDELRKTAAHAVNTAVYPLMFQAELRDRIGEENGAEIENFEIDSFLYRYKSKDISDLILLNVRYDIGIKLPVRFYGSLPVSDILLCRAFVGSEKISAELPFSEMEKEKESVTVWIFPKSGTKYHKENCGYIAVEAREVLLSDAVRREYSPCKLCKPGALSNGSIVYRFAKSGDAYHRGSCAAVDRYVISMEKDEAEARGYTACAKCGGS